MTDQIAVAIFVVLAFGTTIVAGLIGTSNKLSRIEKMLVQLIVFLATVGTLTARIIYLDKEIVSLREQIQFFDKVFALEGGDPTQIIQNSDGKVCSNIVAENANVSCGASK